MTPTTSPDCSNALLAKSCSEHGRDHSRSRLLLFVIIARLARSPGCDYIDHKETLVSGQLPAF